MLLNEHVIEMTILLIGNLRFVFLHVFKTKTNPRSDKHVLPLYTKCCIKEQDCKRKTRSAAVLTIHNINK